VRVAVVGAGRMGGMHAALLGAMPEIELLVVDADGARARAVAESAGGRRVEWSEALERAEAVVLATPSELHCEQVMAALDAGRSVLCEKPLADLLDETLAMAQRAAAEPSVHLEVGFQRRHDAGFVAARRAVTEGETGRLHLVRLTALDPRVPEHDVTLMPTADAAPLFLYSSIHDLDLVRWLTGSEVVEVHAEGSRRDGSRPEDPRRIENALVTMRLADGALAILEASWLHPVGYDVRVEVVAERAHLTMGLSGRTPARHLDWEDWIPTRRRGDPRPEAWAGYLERFEPAYRAELEAFFAAVRGEAPPTTTARDGLEAMRIAVAATRSYRERRTVALAEVAGLGRWPVAPDEAKRERSGSQPPPVSPGATSSE
jgi:myo-inositol 2-dehydrogenase/D-chiro-inositol 1-dehydrogenase